MSQKYAKKAIVRQLLCPLLPDELTARGQSLAATRIEIDRLTEEMKRQSAEYKDQLKGLGQTSRRLSKVVKDRQEIRDIRCDQVLDFVEGRYYVVRTDTGEVMDGRPLTDSERQLRIDGTLPSGYSVGVDPASGPDTSATFESSAPPATPEPSPTAPPAVPKGKKEKKGNG